MLSWFSQRQTAVSIAALGQVGAMHFEPLPVLCAPDPVAAAFVASESSKVRFKVRGDQFRRFADRTVHKDLLAPVALN